MDPEKMEQEIVDKMRCYSSYAQERYGYLLRRGIEAKYAARSRLVEMSLDLGEDEL